MRILIILLILLFNSPLAIAIDTDKVAVDTYLKEVAKLDEVIDQIFQGTEPYERTVDQQVKLLEDTKNQLESLAVPKDAETLHSFLIKKYKPIIRIVEISGNKSGNRQALRQEYKKTQKSLTPILYQAEEAFDELIEKHGISAKEIDINFHGQATKKVNIHVAVTNVEGEPIEGINVSGSFFQDQVIDESIKSAHKGLTDKEGFIKLSGRENIYVDVRVKSEQYKDEEKRVLVRDGKDKDVQFILEKNNP